MNYPRRFGSYEFSLGAAAMFLRIERLRIMAGNRFRAARSIFVSERNT